MKRVMIAFLVLFTLVAEGFAAPLKAGKLRVAVVEFDVNGDIGIKDAGKIVAEWLITDLGKRNVYRLQERALLKKVLKEQKLEVSGLIDEKTAAEIGKLYGVDAIITGSVMKWGDTVSVTARIIDTRTGSIMKTAEIKSYDVDDIPSMIHRLADRLIITPENRKKFVLVVTDGLRFFLPMDSLNGVELQDDISGKRCYGNEIRRNGKGGIVFNCRDSYVDCDNVLSIGDPFTVVAWVRLNEKPVKSMEIVGKDGVFALDVNGESYPLFIVYGVDSVQGKKPLQPGRWYLITASFDRGRLSIYVDGALQEQFRSRGRLRSSDAPLVIGDWSFKTGDKAFCGVIDDVRIYDRALNQHEINQIYSGGRSKK